MELAFDPDSKPVRVPDLETVYEEVSSIQKYAFLRYHIAKRYVILFCIQFLPLVSLASVLQISCGCSNHKKKKTDGTHIFQTCKGCDTFGPNTDMPHFPTFLARSNASH